MKKWLGDYWLGLCGVLVAMVMASCGGQDAVVMERAAPEAATTDAT